MVPVREGARRDRHPILVGGENAPAAFSAALDCFVAALLAMTATTLPVIASEAKQSRAA